MLSRYARPFTAALALTVVFSAVPLPIARADDDLDTLLEQAVKAAVKSVSRSVVMIETSGGTEVIRPDPNKPTMIRKGVGPTTGLVVGADGYVISSAFNFANKPSSIIVAVPGQKERYVATVVALDETRMLTLLKLEGASGLTVPVAAPKGEIKIGHTAIAVGRTFGTNADQPPSVSVGIISALGRIWGKAIQTDAKISPTNYGGPLIDLEGRVQGVLVPASPSEESATAGFEWYDSGIGFAIPLEDIFAVLPRLKLGKNLKRGVLGVSQQTEDDIAAAPVIGGVAPGSAADKAGVRAGDLLLEISGRKIASYAQMKRALGALYEGDAVSLKLKRGKDEVSIDKVVLSGVTAAFGQPFLGILPIRDDIEPGVEVRFVYPKSPAEAAGLKVGDRILKVGRSPGPGAPMVMQPTANREALLKAFESAAPGAEVKLEVVRAEGKKTETLSVKLADVPEDLPAKLPERASAGMALGKKPEPKKEEKKDKDEDDKKVETGLIKRSTAAADHSYWIYVPENYDPNVAHAVVVWLHPAGKNKDQNIDDFVLAWQFFCEDQHIILVGPKTDNERGWTGGDAGFVQEALKAVTDAYTVDRRRVIAHGMGVGGEMAFYLGFNARAVIRGVATTGASLTSNPKEKVGNQPLAFFVAVGGKDPVLEAVRDSRTKLVENKYPVTYRELPLMGHQYLDGRGAQATFEELIRWIDSLDRI